MNLRRAVIVSSMTVVAVLTPSVGNAAGLYWSEVNTQAIKSTTLTSQGTNSTVATATTAPWGVATDGAFIYWAAANSIGRSSVEGTDTDQTFISATSPRNVAVDSKYVYWTQGNGVYRATKTAGSSPVNIVDAGVTTNGITVDDTYVYWTTQFNIGRAKLDGSSPEPTYVSEFTPGAGIVTNGNYIYFTGGSMGRVYRVLNQAGATPVDWISWPQANSEVDAGLATDGTFLYWVDACSACDMGQPAYRGNIARARLDQTDIEYFFRTGLGDVYGLALATTTTQTITFPTIANSPITQGQATLGATASSGLPVTYTSLTPNICVVQGSAATFAAAGVCSISASQAGDATYAAATSVTQSFTITPLPGPLATSCPTGSCANKDLTGVDLQGLDLRGINFDGATLDRANLSGANFENGIMDGVSLIDANLSGANFSRVDLINVKLGTANLTDTNFTKARISDSNFLFARLDGANFTRAYIGYSTFTKATLARAKFTFAVFSGNDVRAKKTPTSFASANITKADFTGADAHGISFKKANATKANFSKANLKKADFRGAKTKGAKFKGAKTKGAKGL